MVELDAGQADFRIEFRSVKAPLPPLEKLGLARERRLDERFRLADREGAVLLIFGPEPFRRMAGELGEIAGVKGERGLIAFDHAVVLHDKNRVRGAVEYFAVTFFAAVQGVHREQLRQQIGD